MERIEIKISKGKKHVGQSSERTLNVKLLLPSHHGLMDRFPSCLQSVKIHTAYCQPRKLNQASVFGVVVGAPLIDSPRG